MKIIFLSLFIFSCFTMFSQTDSPDALTDTSMKTFLKGDISFSGLGFSLETPVSKKFLVETEVGLGAGYDITDSKFNYMWTFNNPAFYGSVRGKYYYNRANRLKSGKGIFMNAGNFVGMRVKYASENIAHNNVSNPAYNSLLINLHWGIQRQIGKYWMYSLYAGLGYGRDIDYEMGSFYPAIDLKFSYVFPCFGKKSK